MNNSGNMVLVRGLSLNKWRKQGGHKKNRTKSWYQHVNTTCVTVNGTFALLQNSRSDCRSCLIEEGTLKEAGISWGQ